MTNLKTALISGVMTSMMATSAFALNLSLGADAGIDVNVDDAATLSVTSGASANADANTTADPMSDQFADYESDEENEFMSDVVFSSDGSILGEVDEVMVDAEGKQLVFIEIVDTVNTDALRVYMTLGANFKSDGTINLDMTEAEFEDTVDAQLKSQS